MPGFSCDKANTKKVLLNDSHLVSSQRLSSIDVMRGIVVLLMVLDHTRDFLGSGGMNPRDVSMPALFLTRWITHFCAPAFVFLSGVSAWFVMRKLVDVKATRRYLLLRGLWLIILECTLVRWGWSFDWKFNVLILQVIWALGWGMILLSLLISLPRRWIGFIGIVMVAGHHFLDPIHSQQFSDPWLSMIWHVLHEPGRFALSQSVSVLVVYPLIPWSGVMTLGFAMAPEFVPGRRKASFYFLSGGLLVALFLLMRWIGFYGDPQPWRVQSNGLASLLSFLDCEKYPPSLLYLLMTLGPLLLFYPLMGYLPERFARILEVFGRVPLFLYVIHLPLLHAIALLQSIVFGSGHAWLLGGFPLLVKPPDYGLKLIEVYFAWLLVLLMLYPVCLAYGRQKIVSRKPWHWLI
jgi:uncharacterized membrane protein